MMVRRLKNKFERVLERNSDIFDGTFRWKDTRPIGSISQDTSLIYKQGDLELLHVHICYAYGGLEENLNKL